MQRNGFIILIIMLSIIVAWIIFFVHFFSKDPSENAKQSVKSITMYPKSTNWQVDDKPKICFYYLNRCSQTPAKITFSTNDAWPSIYEYYKAELKKYGWETKSHIITSIPSSMILKNDILFKNTTCELTIKEKGRNLFNIASEVDGNVFVIESKCL